MDHITLHTLHPYAATCLNRDDVGAPKSLLMGGAPRARISSQCFKRAIREMCREMQPDTFGGQRGHFLYESFKEELLKNGLKEDDASRVAGDIVAHLGKRKQDPKYEGAKTAVALFMSPQEVKAISQMLTELFNEGKLYKGKTFTITKGKTGGGPLSNLLSSADVMDMADIGLYGRMMASDHSLTIEGAAMVSHAFSTHQVTPEVDFFSAVDETKMDDSSAGAGHTGLLEYNSACYYRCIAVNVDLLRENLPAMKADDLNLVLDTFLRASLQANPSARKNSMFDHSLPAFALGLRSKMGHPISMAKAFECAVKPNGGYVKPSEARLEKELEKVKTIFDIHPDIEVRLPQQDINTFIKTLL